MIDWVFGKKKGAEPDSGGPRPSYEEAKQIAASGDASARQALAAHGDLEPELLYYFANDDSPDVRQAVAQNSGTPLQADKILAGDDSDAIRTVVAEKVCKLAPELDQDENVRMAAMVYDVMSTLATDQLPQVRSMIAEEVKNLETVPRNIVTTLAKDVEASVAAPVLEFSPLLEDDDLVSFIVSGLKDETLSAIARRDNLSETVSGAVVGTNSAAAMGELLRNESAQISDDSFEQLCEVAQNHEEWHELMVNRPELPGSVAQKLSNFVAASLVERISERDDLPEDVLKSVTSALKKRVGGGELIGAGGNDSAPSQEQLEDVKREHTARQLDESVLGEALARQNRDFVLAALSVRTKLPLRLVESIVDSSESKPIMTLAWRSGLSAGFGMNLQEQLGAVPEDQVIRPDGDNGFPIPQEELEFVLDQFVGR